MPATQIDGQQILAGSVTDTHVAAGAGIGTTKLAEGPDFLKRDGSVAMTGDLSAGGNKITNLTTPVASTDAANRGYVDQAVAALQSLFVAKGRVRAATTADITLSNPGTAIFDGVTLSNGDVLFVRAQSTGSQNGLYVFNGSGAALTRSTNMDEWSEFPGAFFAIEEGTTYADTMWLCTNDTGGTLGTTSVTFMEVTAGGLTSANFIRELPSGSVNGSNVTFTITSAPVTSSEDVYLNGVLQYPGASNDYTLSGTTITFNAAPQSGGRVVVKYMV